MLRRFTLLLMVVACATAIYGCGSDSPPKTDDIPTADGSTGQPSGGQTGKTVKPGDPEPGVPQQLEGQPADETIPGSKRVDNPYPSPSSPEEEVKASFAKVIVAMRDQDVKEVCASVIFPKSIASTSCAKSASFIMPKLTKENRANIAASYNVALEQLKKAKVTIRGNQAELKLAPSGLGSKIKVIKKDGTWKPVWG